MSNKTVVAIAGATVLAGGWLAPAAHGTPDASTARTAACHGGRAGDVFSHRDVDGDGRGDVVREQGLRVRRVAIRVEFSGGGSTTRVVRGKGLQGSGATALNDARGAEVVVVNRTHYRKNGAWLESRVLTYRNGRLRPVVSPTGGTEWRVHSRADLVSGWAKRRAHGRLYVTHRTVRPTGHGKRYAGRAVTFTWRDGQWDRVRTRAIGFDNRRRATAVAGWHMPGVQVWLSC